MSSASPSQLSAFGSNMYAQPPASVSAAMNNISIQQRGMTSAPFPRTNPGHVTPTSVSQGFPMGIPQQQASPNSRNLYPNVDQRSILSRMQQTSQQQQPQQQPQQPPSLSSQLKQRPNPITSSIISSQTNTSTSGMASVFGRAQITGMFGDDPVNQAALDLSVNEFPTLGNRSAAQPPNPIPAAVRNYVGMVSKPSQEPAPEFQIQQEEFPALPSAQSLLFPDPPASSSNEISRKTPSSSPSLGSYEAALSREGAKFPGDKGGPMQRRGIQTHHDGTVSNIPHGMVTDQFGMVGLLTFIRAADTDPNLVALAPGIDLTTLGLNLNSPENLYSTFQSPWADSPCRPQDIDLSCSTDFHVPQEYLTNIFIRDKLAPIKLNRYGEDLLFFLFYMNGGDVLQLMVAAELHDRDWRYHREEKVWMTRVPGLEPQMKTTAFERGTYYFFDAHNWRKVPKEFRLEYDKLEDRPHLPPTLHQNPNQPQVMAH